MNRSDVQTCYTFAMLKAIIFDFDGIIADSEPIHFQAFLMVTKSLGFTFDYEKYLQDFIGFDDRDAFHVMLDMAGFEGDKSAKIVELCAQKQLAFETLVNTGVPALPGVLALIDEASGVLPIAIASGATQRDITLMLKPLERYDAFACIVSADDVTHSKPDPESYAMAAAQLGIEPGACLAIEDTAAGLTSAREAGLMTLGVTTTGPASALHQANRVVQTLEGIDVASLRQWYG